MAAQDNSLTVLVTDDNEVAIPGAIVEIVELNLASITNESGEASFILGQFQQVTLHVSLLGYGSEHRIVDSQFPQDRIKIILKEKATELGVVTIQGSQSDLIRNTPYAPDVLSLDAIRSTPQPMAQLINQMPGIRVRQSGGMGSQSNIMLHGLDGKGVRVFVDNIPVYLMGDAYNINNISPNMIDRIEVYKGLIPVQFGSDALGGIIHLVSRKSNADFLDVNYTVGSWNTHEAGLNSKKYFGVGRKYFAAMDVSYSHSDNNYWIKDREVPIDELGNTALADVRRFHDGYTSMMARGQVGINNLAWANDLRLIISASQIMREWQHGFSADIPWGQPVSDQWSVNSALSWMKSSKKPDQWDATMMAGFNLTELSFVDTASRTYFWDGSFVPKSLKGESGIYADGRTPILLNKNFFYRASLNYSLAKNYRLNLSTLTSFERLVGEDKAGASTYKEDPFKTPQDLFKNYIGLALESEFFGEVITNIFSVKHFYSHSYAVNLKADKTFNGYLNTFSSDIGFGDVLRWRLSKAINYTLGFEYTVRQPDSQEVFGDYINIGPNPTLVPEKSRNINTSIQYNAADKKITSSISAFYRNTSDRIFLSAISTGLSSFLNLLNTETYGGEADVTYSPMKNFMISLNSTFQNITLNKGDSYGKVPGRYIGARLPNTPYFFGNGRLDYTLQDPEKFKGTIQFGYSFNYIHEFFRAWAVDGRASSKEVIPAQGINNLMISYLNGSERWSLGLECRNVFNEEAYDNFSVQKAGRSIYLKARILLSK
ncbi:outer membrane receptor protein involved in Fe transport [Algoriphagus sp. 4150]|uniref:TonB-dependent receptor n=1 Tax=Algoriphagus sp. 4150 TaxID=2817756 RepID=UPI002854884B|nr:TonB-dependent receptor plug domain-containing protein [Algoriphagus sp. 4150]MDR7131241.1 outer membrane receptor protein involved in Fe transport [Algoriphagus sp. 4150]